MIYSVYQNDLPWSMQTFDFLRCLLAFLTLFDASSFRRLLSARSLPGQRNPVLSSGFAPTPGATS
jgi:hypothetical protein